MAPETRHRRKTVPPDHGFGSAFNQLDRPCFLCEIRPVSPGLAGFERQCCLVRPRKVPSKKRRATRRPRPRRAISEGQTQAESTSSSLDFTAFFLNDGTLGGSHETTQTFLTGFESGLDDKGVELNQSKCDYIPANPALLLLPPLLPPSPRLPSLTPLPPSLQGIRSPGRVEGPVRRMSRCRPRGLLPPQT